MSNFFSGSGAGLFAVQSSYYSGASNEAEIRLGMRKCLQASFIYHGGTKPMKTSLKACPWRNAMPEMKVISLDEGNGRGYLDCHSGDETGQVGPEEN